VTTPEVVITGMGVVSPLGVGLGAHWQGLVSAQSAARGIGKFDASRFPTTFAAEVPDFRPAEFIDEPKLFLSMDLATQFAVAATAMALRHAGLDTTSWIARRVGIYLGITGFNFSDYESVAEAALRSRDADPQVAFNLGCLGKELSSPSACASMILSSPVASTLYISRRYNVRGPFNVISTACAAGSQAIGEAKRAIERGDADLIITGGTEESVNPMKLLRFCLLGALSRRNDDASGACRPFDAGRDGFVLADGAGILVLESRAHAERRGAPIQARLSGYGASSDAYRVTDAHPAGDGAALAMRLALADAGLRPEDVDYVNAHGTSTPSNDLAETRAIKRVFGAGAHRVPVSSTKSMTGHLISAAGAVECITAVQALQHQTIPPTINYSRPSPECDLDYVPNRARPAEMNVVLSNSFGFGGQNSVLVVDRRLQPAPMGGTP
jgi:3-oxoacyl-[acyl-carrier-protein] synthase II